LELNCQLDKVGVGVHSNETLSYEYNNLRSLSC